MKTVLTTVAAIFITLTLLSSCTTQSRYVAARPTVMVPPPPFAGAVWTGPEYHLHGGHYVYMAPRYVAPRRNHSWQQGYWDQHRGKKVWVKGKWAKQRRR